MNYRSNALPSHVTRPTECRLNRVEYRSMPIVLKCRPTPFNRIVLAVIRRIVNEVDFQVRRLSKFHDALDEPGTVAASGRTAISVNRQFVEGSVFGLMVAPPISQAVHNEITGLGRLPKVDR
jgi:hypothetical protein